MVRVNEKWNIPWREGMTVEDLLTACRFSHSHLVVSRNGTLVPPEEYGSHRVSDGDEVRVIHVIGGGQ